MRCTHTGCFLHLFQLSLFSLFRLFTPTSTTTRLREYYLYTVVAIRVPTANGQDNLTRKIIIICHTLRLILTAAAAAEAAVDS